MCLITGAVAFASVKVLHRTFRVHVLFGKAQAEPIQQYGQVVRCSNIKLRLVGTRFFREFS